MQFRAVFRGILVAVIVALPPTAGCHNLFRKAGLHVIPDHPWADATFAEPAARLEKATVDVLR